MAQTDTPITDSSRSVYAVAGGNHITILLGREATRGEEDIIEVPPSRAVVRRRTGTASRSGSASSTAS